MHALVSELALTSYAVALVAYVIRGRSVCFLTCSSVFIRGDW